MYVAMCTCIHTCIYVCVCVYVCMYVCVYVYIDIQLVKYAYVCMPPMWSMLDCAIQDQGAARIERSTGALHVAKET